MSAPIYAFETSTLEGQPLRLADYAGKVMLLVNVASKCGYTPQYDGLESLWIEFGEQGFVVIGFPCNQFGHQEPGNSQEIAEFCQMRYGVTFPLSEKIDVNGKDAHPLYRYLTSTIAGAKGDPDIPWNFSKFLVDRDGKVVARFVPGDPPAALRPRIEALLATPA